MVSLISVPEGSHGKYMELSKELAKDITEEGAKDLLNALIFQAKISGIKDFKIVMGWYGKPSNGRINS